MDRALNRNSTNNPRCACSSLHFPNPLPYGRQIYTNTEDLSLKIDPKRFYTSKTSGTITCATTIRALVRSQSASNGRPSDGRSDPDKTPPFGRVSLREREPPPRERRRVVVPRNLKVVSATATESVISHSIFIFFVFVVVSVGPPNPTTLATPHHFAIDCESIHWPFVLRFWAGAPRFGFWAATPWLAPQIKPARDPYPP